MTQRKPSNKIPAAGYRAWRVLLGCVFLLMCCAGCNDGEKEKALIDSVQRSLQINDPQKAIDLLTDVNSPEAHYLRAVALSMRKRPDMAQEEIDKALALDPGSPKYRVFQLRLKFANDDVNAVKQVLELYETFPNDPSVALTAFYALEVDRIRAGPDNEERAAELRQQSRDALQKATVLSEQIPEFQREMLRILVPMNMGDDALVVARKLEETAPDDPEVLKLLTSALTLAGKFNEAGQAAYRLFQLEGRKEETAVVVANTLMQAPYSEENTKIYDELYGLFPANATIVSNYALYLARSGRVADAASFLNRAIIRQPDPEVKQNLVYMAIDIPLEVTNPNLKLIRTQLDRFRKDIDDPLLIKYFEGRLNHLTGNTEEALKLLGEVAQAQTVTPGSDRSLAKEALRWMKKILEDRMQRLKLGEASGSVGDVVDVRRRLRPVGPVPAPVFRRERNRPARPSLKGQSDGTTETGPVVAPVFRGRTPTLRLE